MTDKNVIVTGGAGYIGSHACKALAAAGYTPIVYDNLSKGFRDFVRWGELVEGELHDTKKLVQLFETTRPCGVLHFAAHADVGESVTNPAKYQHNNVEGTRSLLNAMNATGVQHIVFSSTCAIYGTPDNPSSIDEQCVRAPINPYGDSKKAAEEILFAEQTIRCVSLRYFNAAGADAESEIGEQHDPETHLIPLAIQAAADGTILKIFGTDFPTPDGTAIRDYVHVSDLADAHVQALHYLMQCGVSDAFNLGTGTGHSVQQIVATLRQLGLQIKTENAPRRAGDPAILIANAQKAQDVLGWRARYDNLGDILQTAMRWHQKTKP